MTKSVPIPPLRRDLEVEYRANDTIDVRDPHLLQVFTVDAYDLELALFFNGKRDSKAVKKKIAANNHTVSTKRIEEIARALNELRLLDTPDVWAEEPRVENAHPPTQISFRKKDLEAPPVTRPGAKWSCKGSCACCHGWAVELTEEEDGRIDIDQYRDVLGDDDFAEYQFVDADEPAQRVLSRRAADDLACIFLDPTGHCYIHARQGMEAKPDICQMFPLYVLKVPGGPARLGVRVSCESMHETYAGCEALSDQTDTATRVLRTGCAFKAPKKVRFLKKRIRFEAFDEICQTVEQTFREQGVNAKTLRSIDDTLFGGKAQARRRRFAQNLLKYLRQEARDATDVDRGALLDQVMRLHRGKAALKKLKAGKKPGQVAEPVEAFLKEQIANVLYNCGPLNLPDAGYGMICLLLVLETILHAIGKKGDLATAGLAFSVFTGPLLENTGHSWPMLDAIDSRYVKRLKKK